MVSTLVINLSEATAAVWVQTVRNPAGEIAISNEEGEPFSATVSKQAWQWKQKWQVRELKMTET